MAVTLQHKWRRGFLFAVVLLLLLAGCSRQEGAPTVSTPSAIAQEATATPQPTATTPPTATVPTPTPAVTATPPPSATPTVTPTATLTPTPDRVRFAVIGDYGLEGQPNADVSAMVDSWQPDLILTTGDNNYPAGDPATIDANIGQYYADYIYPYLGSYPREEGNEHNRFFPTLGNHDADTDGGQHYVDYFTLPGNERYYDFIWGPVHFFAVNSNWNEPDGISATSTQAMWLQERLAASTAPWRVVYFHAAPYSSGWQGSTAVMRWPIAEWGASVVFNGHEHVYEHLIVDGLHYFTIGASGYPALYSFVDILPESQFRFNEDYGALRVEATPAEMQVEFITRDGTIVDRVTIANPDQ